jgi:hypothetical protein
VCDATVAYEVYAAGAINPAIKVSNQGCNGKILNKSGKLVGIVKPFQDVISLFHVAD